MLRMKRFLILLSLCFGIFNTYADTNKIAGNFDFLPEVLATAFDQDITKAELIKYVQDNPEEVPEWLPAPYNRRQAALLAKNFVDMRELSIGAAANGFKLSAELAAEYLRKEVAELTEDERAELDQYLKDNNLNLDGYINTFKNSAVVQQQAADAAYMDSLAKYYLITDEDLQNYYKEHLEDFMPRDADTVSYIHIKLVDSPKNVPGRPKAFVLANEIFEKLNQDVDFYLLAQAYSADNLSKDDSHVLPRMGVPKKILSVYDTLATPGEYSKPFEMGGAWYIIRKELLPVKSFERAKNDIIRILRKQRFGDAQTALHSLSKLKLNFETEDNPDGF